MIRFICIWILLIESCDASHHVAPRQVPTLPQQQPVDQPPVLRLESGYYYIMFVPSSVSGSDDLKARRRWRSLSYWRNGKLRLRQSHVPLWQLSYPEADVSQNEFELRLVLGDDDMPFRTRTTANPRPNNRSAHPRPYWIGQPRRSRSKHVQLYANPDQAHMRLIAETHNVAFGEVNLRIASTRNQYLGSSRSWQDQDTYVDLFQHRCRCTPYLVQPGIWRFLPSTGVPDPHSIFTTVHAQGNVEFLQPLPTENTFDLTANRPYLPGGYEPEDEIMLIVNQIANINWHEYPQLN